MAHDLSKLERQLETLDKRIADLAQIRLSKQIIDIIHRQPGWTTPAEFLLVSSAVESLTHNIEGQIRQSQQLVDAAKQVKPTAAQAA
jgi:hypothetical protein